jgi:hypothetical protein
MNGGPDNWSPFNNRVEFELADLLYRQSQMPARDIDVLLRLWAASLAPHEASPPFRDHTHLYDTIDSIRVGDVPWESSTLYYDGPRPDGPVPTWMTSEYQVWFRDPRKLIHNIISNPDFKDQFDYVPHHEYAGDNHRFHNFMSGDWAWKQAVYIFSFTHFFVLNYANRI